MILKDQLRKIRWLKRIKDETLHLWDKYFLRKPSWSLYAQLNQPYGTTHTEVKRSRLKAAMQYIPRDARRILDLGCGTGYGLKLLQETLNGKAEITGLGINRDELKTAKDLGLKVKRGDMHAMPFSDKSFDCVFSKSTFEHSIAPYILLCEINRVLTADGTAILVNPDESLTEVSYHFSILSERQMKEMLFKCHFELIRYEIYTAADLKYDVFISKKVKDHDPRFPRISQDGE
jgi:ubiquinone/menaquinone biosynthesis C-methylase UbiE